MISVHPEIVVEIALISPESGGRLSSIVPGEYRGVLGVGDAHFSARWLIPIGGLHPGGCPGTFGVQFLAPGAALSHFPPGATFSVWEGRNIGSGRVLEVCTQAVPQTGA
jgi:hypothetical protein